MNEKLFNILLSFLDNIVVSPRLSCERMGFNSPTVRNFLTVLQGIYERTNQPTCITNKVQLAKIEIIS